ncbi:hypothetical protein LJK87_31350 [Paenibacillus sp. P25]|nr:hypothetical protein LJK87_31350 [Paenibacillus sp. P25]
MPVELMGCLIIYFYEAFRHKLAPELRSELQLGILHIYQSPVYRHPIASMHHHEAKHTALKLLLGHQFADAELLAEGMECARRPRAHVREFGFKEYGRLPWHWHWIQAFTCVYEVVEDPAARAVSAELLEFLWRLRADYYLRGRGSGRIRGCGRMMRRRIRTRRTIGFSSATFRSRSSSRGSKERPCTPTRCRKRCGSAPCSVPSRVR